MSSCRATNANSGRGVNRQLPHLGGPQGVNRKRPHLGNSGRGVNQCAGWDPRRLAERVRRVRVACGDWSRVTGPSVTTDERMSCGVFLDPPYADTAGRSADLYAIDSLSVAHDVREWAIENGRRKNMRIALCGYEGEHEMPDDWTVCAWKASGVYGEKSGANSRRERIWFSPHCLTAKQASIW